MDGKCFNPLTVMLIFCLAVPFPLASCGKRIKDGGSDNFKGIDDVRVACSADVAIGERTEVSLKMTRDQSSLNFNWKAGPGRLDSVIRASLTSNFIAPKQPENITANGAADLDDLFFPSNWMGLGEQGAKYVQVDRASRENPHSGPTCDKWIVRLHKPGDWAAVGWAYPENNWGDQKGRDLSGYSKISFWIRGATDSTRVTLKAGGHDKPGAKFPATMPEISTSMTLTGEWQRGELRLTGDRSNIPVAFVWVVEDFKNPSASEVRFWIDDLKLER